MRKLVVYLTTGFILFIIFYGIVSTLSQPRDDWYTSQRHTIDLDQRAKDAQRDQARADALEPYYRAGLVMLTLGLPLMLLAVGGTAAWKFFRRSGLVAPDALGRLPFQLDDPHYQDRADGALGTYHLTQRTAAAIPAVPVHYSPSITFSPTHNPSLRYEQRNALEHVASGQPLLTLEEALTPTLPDVVRLADVLTTVRSGHLAYGMVTTGELLTIPLTDSFHTLFHGDTRSGKTNAIDSAIVQLHQQRDVRLVLGDFKRELAATWRRSSKVEAVETEPEHIAEMLIEMVHGTDGILQRYGRFEQAAGETGRVIRNLGEYQSTTGATLRQTFIVVDELNAVITAAGKKSELSRSLQVALQTGAGAGCYILSGAQYLDAATFGRSGSKQFVTRAHFGAPDQTALRMIFNGQAIDDEQKVLLDGSKGRGLIKVVGQAAPVAFQALRCDEGDILEAIGQVSRPFQGVSSPAILADTGDSFETLKPTGTADETAETSFTITPEIAQIVRRLAAEKRGKKEIIKLIWGATPGGSAAYKQASGWYDQIVAGGAA